MGGHDHHAPYTVPKANIYKIENADEVLETQRHLARRGLKDPWARYYKSHINILFTKHSPQINAMLFRFFLNRNEVWRYEKKHWGTHGSRLAKFMLRGLPVGVALTAGTIALEMAFGLDGGGAHGHDDHGHGGGGHH